MPRTSFKIDLMRMKFDSDYKNCFVRLCIFTDLKSGLFAKSWPIIILLFVIDKWQIYNTFLKLY